MVFFLFLILALIFGERGISANLPQGQLRGVFYLYQLRQTLNTRGQVNQFKQNYYL